MHIMAWPLQWPFSPHLLSPHRSTLFQGQGSSTSSISTWQDATLFQWGLGSSYMVAGTSTWFDHWSDPSLLWHCERLDYPWTHMPLLWFCAPTQRWNSRRSGCCCSLKWCYSVLGLAFHWWPQPLSPLYLYHQAFEVSCPFLAILFRIPSTCGTGFHLCKSPVCLPSLIVI